MYGFRSPLTLVALACLALPAGGAWAEYPDKPIRFVVPFAAGSATDQLARAVDQAGHRGQQGHRGGGQQARRQRLHRRQRRGQGQPGRLHGADHHQHHPRRQRAPVQEAALRPREGLRACDGAGPGRPDHGGEPAGAGQDRGRVHRAGQEGAGQAELRQRQFVVAHRGRAVPADGARATAARAVQEQSAGDYRPARQPDPDDDHGHRYRPAAG